jgi:ribosomal protein S24E
MVEIKCANCKKGKIVAEYTKLRNEKKISIPEFLRRAKETGTCCAMCIHCIVGKRKAKLYKKIYKDFKTLDLFEE